MREIVHNGVTYRLASKRINYGWMVTVLDPNDEEVVTIRGTQMGAVQLSAIKRLMELVG